MARFKDAAYHVYEEDRIFSVVIEKIGSTTDEHVVLVVYNPGTATSRKELLYHTDSY